MELARKLQGLGTGFSGMDRQILRQAQRNLHDRANIRFVIDIQNRSQCRRIHSRTPLLTIRGSPWGRGKVTRLRPSSLLAYRHASARLMSDSTLISLGSAVLSSPLTPMLTVTSTMPA